MGNRKINPAVFARIPKNFDFKDFIIEMLKYANGCEAGEVKFVMAWSENEEILPGEYVPEITLKLRMPTQEELGE